MRAVQTLRDSIEPAIASIHAFRVETLFLSVAALLVCGRAVAADIGRALAKKTSEKHGIKRFCRFLGNPLVHRDVPQLQFALAATLLRWTSRPVILVDWSRVPSGGDFCMLRAALAYKGRAFPLYTEVHPAKREGNRRVQGRFIKRLREVVGDRRAILVTDAGFRGPWFKQAQRYDFDFLGRLHRGRTKCSADGRSWVSARSLKASAKPKLLGLYTISRSNPFEAFLTVRRQKGKVRKYGSTRARKGRQRHHGVWILACSVELPAKKVAALYSCRMGIEEGFRDDKSHRFGWSFEDCRCRSAKRLEVMLVLIAFATLVALLVGLSAKARGLQRRYQANTVRDRDVLSPVRLGRLVLRRSTKRPLAPWSALASLLAQQPQWCT